MARQTVLHNCGHEQEHELVGNRSYRDRKAEWLQTTLCSDCYKAEVEAERSRLATEAATAAQQSGLPPLVGTEKQVRWAEQIRADLLLGPEQNAEQVRSREREVQARGRSPESVAASEQVLRMLGQVEAETSAGWWIDRRGEPLIMILRRLAVLAWEREKKGAPR